MKLGSHNTMTYLTPKRWYMRPFSFIARCQQITIKQQYDMGIRLFDLRISFDNKGMPVFSHGMMDYKGNNIYNVAKFLNDMARLEMDVIHVRVILERDNDVLDKDRFTTLCSMLEEKFRYVAFFDGRYKKTWETLYEFKSEEPTYIDRYSSTTWKKWDDWLPWLYARLMNNKNKKIFIPKNTFQYLFIDFVDI